MISVDYASVLDALPEPTLITRPDGTIVGVNSAARRLLGVAIGQSLFACAGPSDALNTYLRRSSGSAQPMIGRIEAIDANGANVPFRAYASALRGGANPASGLIIIRLLGKPEQHFSELTKRIGELTQEIRERRRVQAVLEETLSEKQLLLRELNHRVRNNLQMLLSLLSNAKMAASHAETAEALERIASRVAAIAAAHQLLYSSNLNDVMTTEFIPQICRSVLSTVPGQHHLVTEIEAAKLSNDLAVPVALTLNEFITNAVKYGSIGGQPVNLVVSFRSIGQGHLELVVADDGPGFDTTNLCEGASGLNLVRGLARQMSGSLEVTSSSGVECILRFRDGRFKTTG
jgi:two-component sensor histidine kinase